MDNLNTTKKIDYNIKDIIKIIIWLTYAFKIHIFNANILSLVNWEKCLFIKGIKTSIN